MEYPKLSKPKEGVVYHNRCGSDFLCKSNYTGMRSSMVRITDGWTCVAHGIRQYEDGTIEWDYSANACLWR